VNVITDTGNFNNYSDSSYTIGTINSDALSTIESDVSVTKCIGI